MHTTTRHRRSRRALVALAAALVVTTAAASPPTGAWTEPAPWTTSFQGTGNSAGASPYIALVGDSLVYNIGPSAVATNTRTVTGRSTYVNAVAGATWVNFGWPGTQDGYPLVWDLANFLNSRLTIAALATNDARIMTQNPTVYDQTKQYDVMHNAVTQTRLHSSCVMLVNMRKRPVGATVTQANMQKVNDNMTWLAAGGYSGGRVYVADWNSYAAGHDATWFIAGDVHMTATGELEYANFIAQQADHLVDTYGC